MVIFESVLVDTDILIKAFRGDKIKQNNLKHLKDKYCISVISACELLNGARNFNQRVEFNKALRFYTVAPMDERISEIAFSLFKKYSFANTMKISDSFIAATSVRHDFLLYTDNKKDFNFIEGIKFYNEK
jgi:tRNA(fMet)-specific endonuclease VapC